MGGELEFFSHCNTLIRATLIRASLSRIWYEKPLQLQVFKINDRARALYERFGFETIGQTEHHIQMERT